MFLVGQLRQFYADLTDPDCESALALVHSDDLQHLFGLSPLQPVRGHEEHAHAVVPFSAAQKALRTGGEGDGKIFVYNVENVVKVRTGETDYDALQDEQR